DAVAESYPLYRRLRDAGDIPAAVKFQVSVPTPYASVAAWIRNEDQERFFPVYAQAMADEAAAIADIVDHDDLVIQQDVAVEIGALVGAFTAGGQLNDPDFIRQSVADALAQPADDLSICVGVAQKVVDQADFIHMPADRETGTNPDYYAPLRDLEPRRLALG